MFLRQLVVVIFILIANSEAAIDKAAITLDATKNHETHVMQRFDATNFSTAALSEIKPSTAPPTTTTTSITTTLPTTTTTKATTTMKTTTTMKATTSTAAAAALTSTTPSPGHSGMTTATSTSDNITKSTTPTNEESICLNAYESCFSKWTEKYFNDSSIALFCDYSFYSGNACMNGKLKDAITFQPLNSSKPSYSFLECTRLNPHSEPLKQLSWNFLSYCIFNSPTNSSNPDCFTKIQANCTNPTSSKCSSVCMEYIIDQPDLSDPDEPEDGSSSSKITFSILALLISSLILF